MMPKIFRIKEVRKENPNAITIFIQGHIDYNPGQFIMLWLPGIDEKPFAISYHEDDYFAVTIEKKGEFTDKIFNIRPGAKIGIRGPFGNGFTIKNNAMVVAGGLGIAPALSLIKKIKNSIIIQGAKSKRSLLFLRDNKLLEWASKNNNTMAYCTDNGTFGMPGFTTHVFEQALKKVKPSIVYTCGPEMMILNVFNICEKNNIECEASLERFMKCGIGLCGSCAINDQLVCKDGPVFNSEKIRKLTELGKFAKLASGRKVPIKEYYAHKSK